MIHQQVIWLHNHYWCSLQMPNKARVKRHWLIFETVEEKNAVIIFSTLRAKIHFVFCNIYYWDWQNIVWRFICQRSLKVCLFWLYRFLVDIRLRCLFLTGSNHSDALLNKSSFNLKTPLAIRDFWHSNFTLSLSLCFPHLFQDAEGFLFTIYLFVCFKIKDWTTVAQSVSLIEEGNDPGASTNSQSTCCAAFT